MTIRILHLNTEKGWRGGENQTRLLIEGMNSFSEFENHLAALRDSDCFETFKNICSTYPLKSSFPYHLGQARKIAEYCKKYEIDILDAQTGRTHSLAYLVKMFYPSVKVVVHRRVDNTPSQNFFSRKKYRSKRITAFVAISEAIKNILIQSGVSLEKIHVIKSAVPDTPYRGLEKPVEKKKLAQKLGISEDVVWIGNASAIAHQKAYEVLMNAVLDLKSKQIPFQCLIAGTGPQEAEIRKMCADLHLEDKVIFLGFVKEVSSFLSALDILAVPSHNEGLGTILLEGMHAGCSVVGSAVGGIPEIVKDGQTGLLIPPGNPKALSKALQTLIEDQELRQQLARQGKEFVKEQFSVEAMISGNMALYRQLAES